MDPVRQANLDALLDILAGGKDEDGGWLLDKPKKDARLRDQAARAAEKLKGSRLEPIKSAREQLPRETKAQGGRDMAVPVPEEIPKNVISEYPVIEPVAVQTYTETVAVTPRGAATYTQAVNYADQLLKTAHSNVRRAGSVAGNASSVIGPDALSNPVASLHPHLIQLSMAELNLAAGYVASGTVQVATVQVTEIGQMETFMQAHPNYMPVYLGGMKASALGAFLALVRPGGVGAYTWTNVASTGMSPLNALRQYPTGFGRELVVVVEDGSPLASGGIPYDHQALTPAALQELRRWYEVFVKATPFFDEAWKAACALSFGYGKLDKGADDSAGGGFYTCTPMTKFTIEGSDSEHDFRGKARIPKADEFKITPGGGDRTRAPKLDGGTQSVALTAFWRAYVDDGIPGRAIAQGENESTAEYAARIHAARFNLGKSNIDGGGVTLVYALGGESAESFGWDELAKVKWKEVSGVSRRGVEAVMEADQFYREDKAAAADERPTPLAPDKVELYNVYGQRFDKAVVYYPAPELDGFLALIAGISALCKIDVDAGGSVAGGSVFAMRGEALFEVCRRYAAKLNFFANYGLYSAKIDYNIAMNRGTSGPAMMSCIAKTYRNHIFPDGVSESAYPHGQFIPFEAGAHVPLTDHGTEYVGYRVPGAWVVTGESVRMEDQQSPGALAALDCAIRKTYQLGGQLVGVIRTARQYAILHTAGANGSRVYHPFTVPFTTGDPEDVNEAGLIIRPRSFGRMDIVEGEVRGARGPTFVNT